MSSAPFRVSFVHPGRELYGSDRALIETVTAVVTAFPQAAVEAVVPGDGPIVEPLARTGACVVTSPLWVPGRVPLAMLLTVGAVRFVPALIRAALRFRRSDLVYVNTSAAIDHLVAARFFPGRAVVHVREAPEGWKRRVLRALLLWSRAELVFDSRATEAAFGFGPERRAHVVYDGVPDPGPVEPPADDGIRPRRLLAIGRLGRDTGQDVLIDALARISPELRDRLEVRIVGGGGEDDETALALAGRVREAGLVASVSLLPFTAEFGDHYRWADVVVVPTRGTESLGRVAIEAMAHGRPALVSALGALQEIVQDGRTGWFVPPGDVDALARALAAVVERPDRWSGFGAAARERYERVFAERISQERIRDIVRTRLGADRPAAAAPFVEA